MINLSVAAELLERQFGAENVRRSDECVGVIILPGEKEELTFALELVPSPGLGITMARAISWAQTPIPPKLNLEYARRISFYLNQLQQHSLGRWTLTDRGQIACDMIVFSSDSDDLANAVSILVSIMASNITDLYTTFGLDFSELEESPSDKDELTGLS